MKLFEVPRGNANIFKAKFDSDRPGYFTRLYKRCFVGYRYTIDCFLIGWEVNVKRGKHLKLGKHVWNWKIKTILDVTVFRLPFVTSCRQSNKLSTCVCVSFLKLYVLFNSGKGTTEALIHQPWWLNLSDFYIKVTKKTSKKL